MDLYEKIRTHCAHVVVEAIGGVQKDEVLSLLEEPPENIKADYALPCFFLSKKLKKNPAQIAQEIVQSIKKYNKKIILSIDALGPYVNFHANWNELSDPLLKEIHKKKEKYGRAPRKKEKILIEFAHPNTHKAFHLGHVRNIAFGESLSRILEASGTKIIRANYQGDIGPHVAKTVWGVQHLKKKAPTTKKGQWLGKIYSLANAEAEKSEKVENEIREINKKLYAGDKELVKIWKETRKWSLDYFEEVYNDFGVVFDRYYFESEVEKPGLEIAQQLLKKKIAKKSQGAIVLDLKKDNLGIYVLVTQDGTPLYSIKDFALAEIQDQEFSPEKIIHVVATEQILHFRQLFKGLEKTKPKIAKKEIHLPYELVNLPTGKMSSRTGTMIRYDDLRESIFSYAKKETKKRAKIAKKDLEKTSQAIALAALKYDMLKTSAEKVIVFDSQKAISFDGNTGPYLQYTLSRASSILRKQKPSPHYTASLLKHEKEHTLLKLLAQFPQILKRAATHNSPHLLATYTFQLATTFNTFYESLPVLKADKGEKYARLALVKSFTITLSNALELLGITPIERM